MSPQQSREDLSETDAFEAEKLLRTKQGPPSETDALEAEKWRQERRQRHEEPLESDRGEATDEDEPEKCYQQVEDLRASEQWEADKQEPDEQ